MDDGNPVCVISGGSRGLGEALVRARIAKGDIVATYSRRSTAFIDEMQEIDPQGIHFYWEECDSSDPTAVAAFGGRVLYKFKRIDTLINNAAGGIEGLLTMTGMDEIHKGLAINLESVLVLTRQCLKGMLARRSGCIINISSVNAERGHTGLTVYSATKAALHGFTRSLAREVGPQQIRVNSIAPGFFESEMVGHLSDGQRQSILRRTPLKALCTVEDLVETAEFIIRARAITGQTIVVDGGYSC